MNLYTLRVCVGSGARLAILGLLVSSLGIRCWGQNTFPSSGPVGIGITNPVGILEVGTPGTYGAYIRKDVSTALGTDVVNLQLTGKTNADKLLALGYDTTNNFGFIQATTRFLSWDNLLLNPFGGNGHVGIGTFNPQYMLSVNGTIQAKEILVQANWSDYVFDPEYRLTPLTEIADYVRKNRHLPGIPSEADIAKNGVPVGEIQSKLLAKIEELTLHMIRAEDRNNKLEEQNHELRLRVDRLELAGKDEQ